MTKFVGEMTESGKMPKQGRNIKRGIQGTAGKGVVLCSGK